MDATTFFLTYPRSSFDHNEMHEFLQSIKPVVWARVATEHHEDGEEHMHIAVRFGARVRARTDVRLFDYKGRHPNIQSARNIAKVLQYCAKEGNYSDYGQLPGTENVYDVLRDHAQGGDRDGFDKCAMAHRVSFQWAEHIWKRHGTCNTTIHDASPGTECMQLQTLQLSDTVTCVVGPSGCGKSTWATRVAPKPALWVTHLDDLKKLTKEHKSIIFDDMDFAHLPRTTQIYLVDTHHDRTIHCRNTNAVIPKGITKIFTANSKPFIDDEAVNRRIKYYNIISFTF